MQRYCNTSDIGGALQAARDAHNEAREAVRKQEALLTSSMNQYGVVGRIDQDGLDMVIENDLVENYTYVLAALLVPQMVSGDPMTTVRSPGGELSRHAAINLPHAIKKIQTESRFKREAVLAATDTVLGWGVMEVQYEDLSLDRSDKEVIPVVGWAGLASVCEPGGCDGAPRT